MMKAFSIILVLLLAVSTAVPMLVMSHSEINAFRTWFEKLGMESQSIMYALLRIISYPYHRALQNGLLGLHGIVGTVLVVTIGEVLGSGLQLVLFECAQILLPLVGSSVVVHTVVAPIINIRGKPQLEFIASALRGMPIGYSALLQLSAAPILCTFWPPLMLGTIGDSELMINFALGTILGQFINLELKVLSIVIEAQWALEFLRDAVVPAVRTVTTVLLVYWLWQEARVVADGAGNEPEALLDAAADIPTDVDAPDEPEADLEEMLAGAKTAPAGRRVKTAVTSAVKAAAETVRRTGRSAKARVLRFHEAAPAMEDTLKSWTPPQLRAKHVDSARDNSEEPVTRRTRRSTAATPKRSASAVKKERTEARPGLSVATRSRGRSKLSVPGPTEEDSMITSGSMDVSRKSAGPRRGTVEHRLETTLTDSVYNTPGRETRSRRLSHLPSTTAD